MLREHLEKLNSETAKLLLSLLTDDVFNEDVKNLVGDLAKQGKYDEIYMLFEPVIHDRSTKILKELEGLPGPILAMVLAEVAFTVTYLYGAATEPMIASMCSALLALKKQKKVSFSAAGYLGRFCLDYFLKH